MSTAHSKFLSLVLRHQPALIGIVLDDAGWTDVDTLLARAAAHGTRITRAELIELVAASDKQRFALSADGTRIRANQGHSVEVELALAPSTPPALLFHGTAVRFLASIRSGGLVRGARHHVHLSAEVDTAAKVGGRRGQAVVLRVRAGAMAADGHVFYRSANGVWLTDAVPAAYLEFPDEAGPARGESPGTSTARGSRASIARATLAACECGGYDGPSGDGATVSIAAALAAARAGTTAHELGVGALRPASTSRATHLVVTSESTTEAIIRLAPRPGHLAVLNFASAKNPGGGFLGGAQAQEEALARSSGLYPCLVTQPAHYQRQRAHASALYLDLAIWSPAVPFFRDDAGGWLPAPALASVITCAAPNAGALRQQGRLDPAALEATLRRRAAFVLALAAHHQVDHLVLGAWGAGVFGNDPALVADAFAVLLGVGGAYHGAFAAVTLAIPGGPAGANHAAFAARFGG
ncbi:MAG: RNA 2'-phosphotransferase [Kofleriaceae bacterium]|nr:RNA 2'-phosphotransferase [Kofleriaceae bacterium]MBP6838252.1 RNA 2'-phosphotransferase [Kofleriaceae bacterium]